jgi:hypothetical protein
MPKQGRFAASKRVKQLNNFHQKHQQHESRAIDNDQFTDFLLVRFALTTKKKLPVDSRESLQRFLQELTPQLVANHGQVEESIRPLLVKLRTRVPWQFFCQVSDQWETFQHFLKREVPAVPLNQRLPITNLLTAQEFNSLLADSLAEQVVAFTTLQTKLPATMKRAMVEQMRTSIFDGKTIDWEKVRTLFAPVKFDVDSAPDEKTRQWLLDLLAK